ncbi:glycosyltransferase [Alistipes senegalensis]|uniref:glycosyltransferase n=1 Tax=Alistipes senegalensis TaxID=1288121 RepID=UPI0024302D4D|nr:glycosyltransferase [Alistipes senegalensis]
MIDPFKKRIGEPNADRLTAINNPVVTAIPDSGTIPEKEKMAVWCGRLEYGQKRTDRMLQIWKRINRLQPEWQLKILGSGDWDYYKDLIDRHGIKNAEVVGFCNPSEYYARAAILCMTSTTEGFGMVLVEAQSYGCVPIAYNSFSSLHDIITDGVNGISVKAFDEYEYVKKLSQLMSDTDMRNRMAANGIESIHRFDAETIAGQWLDLFDNLLKK